MVIIGHGHQTDKVFQTVEAATEKGRRPMVDRRYSRTSSWMQTTTAGGDYLVDLIPERVDSSTPVPYRAVVGMPWVPVWSWPVPEDAASGVGLSRGRRSRGRSDEVETPNELLRPGGVAEDRQELWQVWSCRSRVWSEPATPRENRSSRSLPIDADSEVDEDGRRPSYWLKILCT